MTTTQAAGKSTKVLAGLMVATGVGLVLFWLMFFTVGLAPENPPPCYFAFEHSFPFPDLILAAALLLAGAWVLKGNPRGGRLALAAAGALVFLGLLDFSFNIRNGMYTISAADGAANAFINCWCVGFGSALVRRFGFQ